MFNLSLKPALTLFCILLLSFTVAYAVESNKPETHGVNWLYEHGDASKMNSRECLDCHKDKSSCIQCHEEVAPRNHNASWTKRTHGLEAKWNRESCSACHKEDSCIECHTSTPPSDHKYGWREPVNAHCGSCHYPLQDTRCYTCHKRAHSPNEYK